MNKIKVFMDILGRLFPVLVIMGAMAGYFSPQHFLPFLKYLVPLLMIIMFGMGMTLKVRDFYFVFRYPKPVIIGVIAQYIIMPVLAWGIAKMLHFDADIALGFILLGACPGGTASNVITFLARGDVALSVAMTSVSTLLSPIFTPVIAFVLASQWIEINAGAMFIGILKIVIVPVCFGILLNSFLEKYVKKFRIFLPAISMVAIILIVAAIIAKNSGQDLQMWGLIIVGVALHNGLGLILGYFSGKFLGLSENQRRTVAIEVGMQNSGLATALAKDYSANASLPGAIFSVWHNITGPMLASYWSRKKKSDHDCLK